MESFQEQLKNIMTGSLEKEHSKNQIQMIHSSETEVCPKCHNCGWVIDDFGTENAKDWKNEKFYSIINGRYVEKKITIFTSNFSLDDLSYDDRIINRIKERVLQIPFPEESIRETLAKKLKEELREGVMAGE